MLFEKESLEDLKKTLESFDFSKLKGIKPSDYVLIFAPLILLSGVKDMVKSLASVFLLYNFIRALEERKEELEKEK